MTLGAGMSYTIPAGSSHESLTNQEIKKYKIELVGPKISCPQEDNLSCLHRLLVSTFVYLKMENFVERVMQSYNEYHLKYPNINYQVQDLLYITNNNVGRLTDEKK